MMTAGLDCVNGSLVSHHMLTSQTWDWATMRKILIQENTKHKHLSAAPHTRDLIIFDKTKVFLYEHSIYIKTSLKTWGLRLVN